MRPVFWICALLCAAALILAGSLAHRRVKKKRVAERARACFIRQADRFGDLLEPLHKALGSGLQPPVKMLLDMWQARVDDCPELAAYFRTVCQGEDSCKSAAHWLDALHRWGVRRDEVGHTFRISQEHLELYMFDDVCSPGDRATVTVPAWWLEEGAVLGLSRGAAIVIQGGNDT